VNISVIFEVNRAKIGYVIPGWYVYKPHRAFVTSNFPNPKPNPKKKRNYERNVLISRSSLEEMEPESDMLVGATTSTRRLEPLSHATLPTGTLTLDRGEKKEKLFFFFRLRMNPWRVRNYNTSFMLSPISCDSRSFHCFNVSISTFYNHSFNPSVSAKK